MKRKRRNALAIRLGIRSKRDILYGLLISVIGPLLLFVAFGQAVHQPINGIIDLTFITYPIGIIATILCAVSSFYAIIGLFLKEKKFKGGTFSGKYSILIPARNEEKVIQDILNDIISQTYKDFEVIVICHNCTDKTGEKVKEISGRDNRIKCLEFNGKPGKSAALNYGVNHATGEIIVVFDADNRIPVDFLEKISPYFPYYDSIQTKIETKNPNFNLLTKLQDLEFYIFSDIFQKTRQNFGLNALLGGTGEVVKKDVLEKVGFYDEWAFSEDFALCTKLIVNKYKIGWCTDTYVLDEKIPWWFDFFKQRARWTKGHLQLITKYILNYWNKPADLHYLLAPLIVLAPSLTMLLWVVFFLQLPLTASFIPLWAWLTPWAAWHFTIAVRVFQKKGTRGLLLFPFLFFYYFHWLAVVGYLWKIKSWPKTPHGEYEYKETVLGGV